MGYGNKGKKKRSSKSGKSSLQPATSLRDGEGAVNAAEGSHQQEQVIPNAEKTTRLNVDAAPFPESKAPLDGESSSFQRPPKASPVPCHFFQRGYCRYGDFCRFQHLEASPASAKPPNMPAKAPSEKSCSPEECLDWHLTGSCPRYRTCRYAHPVNHDAQGSRKNMQSGMRMDSGMGLGGFEYLASQILRHGPIGSRGGGYDNVMEPRMRNCGFTDDDVYELSLQGIKPWDPEAWDALAVLKGGGDFYDDDDYDYDNFGF